jgi:hypothetical protein
MLIAAVRQTSRRLPSRTRAPSTREAQKVWPVASGEGAEFQVTRPSRIEETRNEAALMASAQSTPALNRRGAASGGATMRTVLLAAPCTENAEVRSWSGMVRAIISSRACKKNCPAALVTAIAA